MSRSFWESQFYYQNIDYAIIGAGLTGLFTAYYLKLAKPKAKVVIFEKQSDLSAASTQNAGFACYGSLSEIVSDLKNNSDEDVKDLVAMRFNGIQNLIDILGPKKIELKMHGGSEIFLQRHLSLFEDCKEKLPIVNELLLEIFKKPPFVIRKKTKQNGVFKNVSHVIDSPFEGKLNPISTVWALYQKVTKMGVITLFNHKLTAFEELQNGMALQFKQTDLFVRKMALAVNGLGAELLAEAKITPCRAQVLITKPLKRINFDEVVHMEEGYYYFRMIGKRLLLGGARNIDFERENTKQLGTTQNIQTALEEFLKEILLPRTSFEIQQRWSGIMGISPSKKPFVKRLGNHASCAIGLSGMGVAISSVVASNQAKFVLQ